MNENKPKWYQILLIGFFWILSGGLGLIILALGREVILVIGVNSFNLNRWVIPFVNNAYYFIAGLIWLGMFYFAEAYFSQGFKKKILFQRILRFLGIEVLVIAAMQIVLMIYRFFPLTTLGLMITLAEIVLGISMLVVPHYFHVRLAGTQS